MERIQDQFPGRRIAKLKESHLYYYMNKRMAKRAENKREWLLRNGQMVCMGRGLARYRAAGPESGHGNLSFLSRYASDDVQVLQGPEPAASLPTPGSSGKVAVKETDLPHISVCP